MELPILEYQPTTHTRIKPQISNAFHHFACFTWPANCRTANVSQIRGVSKRVEPLYKKAELPDRLGNSLVMTMTRHNKAVS